MVDLVDLRVGDDKDPVPSIATLKAPKAAEAAPSGGLLSLKFDDDSDVQILDTPDEDAVRRNPLKLAFNEGPVAVVRGMAKAAQETVQFAESLTPPNPADLIASAFTEGPTKYAFNELLFGEEQAEQLRALPSAEALPAAVTESIPAPETFVGEMVQGVSQFVSAFLVANKIGAIKSLPGAFSLKSLPLVNKIPFLANASITLRAGGAGAVADMVAFDPLTPRLSNVLRDLAGFDDPVTEFLAANPGDSEAEGRLKNVIEGLGIGVATDLVFQSLRGARGLLRARDNPLHVEIPPGPTPLPTIDEIAENAPAFQARQRMMRVKDDLLTQLQPDRSNADELARNFDRAAPFVDPDARILAAGDIDAIRGQFLREAKGGTPAQQLARVQREIARLDAKPTLSARATKELAHLRGDAERLGDIVNGTSRPDLVQKSYEADAKAAIEATEVTWPRIKRVLQEQVTDKAGTIKDSLVKEGPYGEEALRRFVLSTGAPGSAHQIFNEARAGIYGTFGGDIAARTGRFGKAAGATSLTKSERQALDGIIKSRRFMEILRGKPNFKMRLEGGRVATRGDFEGHLGQLRRTLGDERFLDLNARANVYFNTIRGVLGRLAKGGVITPKDLERLSKFDFSPLQLLDEIDPSVTVRGKGGRKITVRESGIPALGRGTREVLETDSEKMLGEFIGRAEARIAKNRANQALLDIATNNPDNGLVALKRPKEGSWSEIFVRTGKDEPTRMYLPGDLAEQWSQMPSRMPESVAKALSVFSGSSFVRAMATGVNMGFAVAQIPIDMGYQFLRSPAFHSMMPSSRPIYSKFAPWAMGQMVADRVAVMGDSFLRKGAYRDFVEEGGAFSFMSHGAKDANVIFRPSVQFSRAAERRLLAFRIAGAYFSESTEIMGRLAIRRAAMRAGADGPTATFVARDILDFSQGGHAVKALDIFVPYLNASTQAVRGMFNTARVNPKEFWGRIGQMSAGAGGLWAYNYFYNRKTWDSIPPEVKNNNWIITTPLKRRDDNGDIRHYYFTIPVDPAAGAFKAMTEMAMEKAWTGKAPSRQDWDRASSAITDAALGAAGRPGSLLPPIGKAFAQYTSNYDFFLQDNIWKGKAGIEPSQEFLTDPHRPTPMVARDVGELLGLSPARMQRALGAVAPRNQITTMLSLGYEALRENEVPEQLMFDTTDNVMKNSPQAPVLRRFFKQTHPLEAESELLDPALESGRTEAAVLTRDLDERVSRVTRAPDDATRRKELDNVRQWIRTAPPIEQARLADRAVNIITIDKIFRDTPPEDLGIPTRTWWLRLQGESGSVKAEAFHTRARNSTAEQRDQMKRMAGRLKGWGPKFATRLGQLEEEYPYDPE